VRPPFRAGRTKPAVEGEPIAPLKSGISDERIGGAPIGSRRPILTVRHTHAIVEAMFAICNDFEAYGYCRVGAALRQQGLVVNHKKIRRLMKHGLQPRIRRRFVTTTDSDHDGPIFPPSRASQGCVARTLDDDAKSEIRADPASRYAAISKRLATKAA
jgi:hypothetical protein